MHSKKLPLLIAFLFAMNICAFAQLNGWNYRQRFNANDTSGIAQSNYQVKISVNTAALIAAGQMQSNGEDIRFADSCASVVYNHYVESGMNSSATIIWVMVPTIPANGSTSFYMHYGNSTATGTSSFSATFPNAFVSGGNNAVMTGNVTYDWFQLDVNDTVFTTAGSLLSINARNVLIDGVIFGSFRGYTAPAANFQPGGGPGGGTPSPASNSGSGGASYGGVGGTGGFDAGDTPGTGGPVYGTATGTDIDMGSSGATGGVGGFAGPGGGGVAIAADYVVVNGSVRVDGGIGGSAGQCGSGGSGGGILFQGGYISLIGTLTAMGGNGGPGTSTANDSGGGGGGGRIKAFASAVLNNTATTNVGGGIGGPNGGAGPGQPGTPGTTHYEQGGGYDVPVVAAGNIDTLIAPSISLNDTVICASDSIVATASGSFSSYTFTVNAIPVYSGPLNSVTIGGLGDGDDIGVSATVGSCLQLLSNTIMVVVNPLPSVVATTSDDSICSGVTDTLTATGALTYAWSTGGSGVTEILAPVNSTTVVLTGTDINGCSSTDTVSIYVHPSPQANAGQDVAICEGDSIMLMGGGGGPVTICLWLPAGPPGGCNPIVSPSVNTTYIFTLTDSITGCSDADTMNVTVYSTPQIVITASDSTICQNQPVILTASGAPTITWLPGNLSGSPVTVYPGQTTTFTATGITQNGCSDSDSLLITVNQIPTVIATAADYFVCTTDAPVAVTGTPAGGTWSGNGYVNNTFDPTITGSGLHSIVYSYTDPNGCSMADTITIDVNGCVGVNEIGQENTIHVYPVPNNGQFVIETSGDIQNADLVITDISGRVVLRSGSAFANSNRAEIDLSHCNDGIYFVTVRAEGLEKVSRIVIQH